ncbi:helix-turn-helix domain-containing protein [Streptomyces sp. NPDC058989]|uniref:helix-turn-helix domain-containing protein n=1 Tax=Streptomyces sp. NPDC058989 TaxID=3346686 RepID=UPI0036CBBA4F
MSIHLMLAAAYLPKEVINKTQKMVLMKIADSADDQTLLARPGLERMMAWAGVGEKQVITIVTELVGLGFVERVEVGRVGRRAEYKVFPHGVPPIPTTEELIERRRLARRAPKNPRLARQTKRRKPSTAARTQQDVAAREEARAARGAADEGGLPEGNPGSGEGRVPPRKPGRFPQGNQEGSPTETPSFPSHSSVIPYPPTPTAGAAGEPDGAGDQKPPSGCAKHPRPVGNCRGCGTNPRAGREQARREAAASEHTSQQQWLKEFFAERERRVADTDPEALAMAKQRTKELARMGSSRASNSGAL